MIRVLLSVLCALAFTAALSARAERLSLEQAVGRALDHNPALGAVGQQAEAARAQAEAARGARWPQLNLRYSARRSDNPLEAFGDKLLTRSVTAPDFDPAALNDPDPSRLHATELVLNWPIYTGGRVSASIRGAEQQEQAARLGYERVREQLAFRVRAAYFEAQAAAEGVRIAEDAAAAGRAHAATTARLAREARAVASDPLTADLHRAALESAREQALTRSRAAMEKLRRLLALPSLGDISLDPWTPPAGAAPVAAGADRALGARRDLQAARAAAAAGASRVEEMRAAFHPQFGLVASESWYDRDPGFENRAQTVMGVLSINLFRGGSDAANLAAARAQATEAALRVEEQRAAIRQELATAQRALEEAAARRRLAEGLVGQARENLRLVQKRYGEGRTLLIELLQAERLLLDARREALEAGLADAVGRARLALAEGTAIER